MDVITKEGPLLLQGVKFGKKTWRKMWLVVFEPSAMGAGRIELYDLREGWKPTGPKKMDKRVIRLSDCLSITPAPGESCPTNYSAFFLNTTTCTFTISAPTHEDWISVLCRLAFQKSSRDDGTKKSSRDKCIQLPDNELYSTWGVGQFQVRIQSTDASQRCRMSGTYLLSAGIEAVCLLDLQTGQAIQDWPYRFLRKFGQVKGGIMIEAGRRCQTGEGQFIFLSSQGSQIHRAIEEAIMHQSIQELLAKATALPQELPSQPASLESKTQDRSKVNKPPPINIKQERPRLPFQCKPGRQIHKAIEEALMHQSLVIQDLRASSPPRSLPPPTSPKPKIQDQPKDRSRDKPRLKKNPPISFKEKEFYPPVIQKHSKPINKVTEEPLTHNDAKKLWVQSHPLPQAPPPPPRLAVQRKNITPNPASLKSPLRSPDDVVYASIVLQPKARSQISLPKTTPSVPSHLRVHNKNDTGVSKDKEWNSLQKPSENNIEDNPYNNWTAAKPDQTNVEALYSKVNFAAKLKNRNTGEIGDQGQTSITNIRFKDPSEIPPAVPSRKF